VLELHEADGAFERIESWLRDQGFFVSGGEALVADLFLGYGLSDVIRRHTSPAPPEPCPIPLAACAVRRARQSDVSDDNNRDHDMRPDGSDHVEVGDWRRSWAPEDHAAAVDAVRDAIARGDVYQVNLAQHLSAPFAGTPRALAARLVPLTQFSDLPFADTRWRLFDLIPVSGDARVPGIALSPAMQALNEPTPGNTMRCAPRTIFGSAVTAMRSAPAALSAL